MFPLLSILVALTLGLSYRQMMPGAEPADLPATVAAILAVTLAGKTLMVLAVRRALEERKVEPYFAAAFQIRLLAVVGYGFIVYICRWPGVVDSLGIGHWILVDELVVLAPFFLLLLLSFHITWTGESSLELHDFRQGEYILFQSRQVLLPVAPIFVFLLAADLVTFASRHGVRWVAEAKILADSYPFVQWAFFGLFLLLLYLAIPFAMRILWRLEPLPPGPVRDRLLDYSRRVGFKAREILLWPTGENILNAAVIGITGRLRYVLMTDALVRSLELDEVEAVFAHEVGHAKHRHLLKFFLFILGYALLMYLIVLKFGDVLDRIIGDSVAGVLAFSLGGLLIWFGLLLGFVSRRFEQQADVYGALTTDHHGPEEEHPFVRALERIATQLGDIREMKGWRHFPLSSRIGFITRFVSDPGERRRYRRRMAGLTLFFFGLLTAIGVAAALTIPAQIREGRTRAALARARWLDEHGRRIEALEILKDLGVLREEEQKSREELRLLAMRETDRAGSADFLERFSGLWRASRAYLDLGMPGAARVCLEEILMMTAPLGLPPSVRARLIESMGVVLAAESRFRGARLAYRDALALVPEESPDARRLRQRLRRLDSAAESGDNR